MKLLMASLISGVLVFGISATANGSDTCNISCAGQDATIVADTLFLRSTGCSGASCSTCLTSGLNLEARGVIWATEGDCGGWPRDTYICESIIGQNGVVCGRCYDNITVDAFPTLLPLFECTVVDDGDYFYLLKVNDATGMSSCGACSTSTCTDSGCNGPCDAEATKASCIITVAN